VIACLPPGQTAVGRVLRYPLRMIPPTALLRVLRGPARGARWIAGAGPHGMWLGSYERHLQRALSTSLDVGGVFFDVGANAGFYTVLAARLVGTSGRVVAFEPLAENLRLLRRHIELNALANVDVLATAITDTSGRARFVRSTSRFTSHLEETGEFEVPTASLDSLLESGSVPCPSVIKMDIEGGERRALAGARRTLLNGRPIVIVATHGEKVHSECRDLLAECGYRSEVLGVDGHNGHSEVIAVPSERGAEADRGEI
jgi:FkbM family methyltransferase